MPFHLKPARSKVRNRAKLAPFIRSHYVLRKSEEGKKERKKESERQGEREKVKEREIDQHWFLKKLFVLLFWK